MGVGECVSGGQFKRVSNLAYCQSMVSSSVSNRWVFDRNSEDFVFVLGGQGKFLRKEFVKCRNEYSLVDVWSSTFIKSSVSSSVMNRWVFDRNSEDFVLGGPGKLVEDYGSRKTRALKD